MGASSRKNGASVRAGEVSQILSSAEWEYLGAREGWKLPEVEGWPQVVGMGDLAGLSGVTSMGILSICWLFQGELRPQR